MHRFGIIGINPEPWTAAQVGIVNRGGKPSAQAFPNEKVKVYQAAIADEVDLWRETEPSYTLFDVAPLHLTFYFWRSTAGGQPADATNLQKSTEDALQGHLFKNDSQIAYVETRIMEQSPTVEPLIGIAIDAVLPALPSLRLILHEQARKRQGDGLSDNRRHLDDDPI